MHFKLTVGERQAITRAESLLARFDFASVTADSACDGDGLRQRVEISQVE